MGTESDFTWAITGLIRGIADPAQPVGLGFVGETPNHRAMAAVAAYGWSARFGSPSQQAQARAQVSELLAQQSAGDCAWGAVNECLSPSHFNFWGLAFAALAWFALEGRDGSFAAAAAGWWQHELSLFALLSVPYGPLRGSIVAPGHRTFYTPRLPASGVSICRDVVYGLTLGLASGHKPESWFGAAIDRQRPALDRAAAWVMLQLLRAQLDPLRGARQLALATLAGDLSHLPSLRDTLRIVRTREGHVAWFERMTGLGGQPAQYWAWCDYTQGTQRYGLQPTAEPPAPPGGWTAGWKIVVPGTTRP